MNDARFYIVGTLIVLAMFAISFWIGKNDD